MPIHPVSSAFPRPIKATYTRSASAGVTPSLPPSALALLGSEGTKYPLSLSVHVVPLSSERCISHRFRPDA